MDNIRVRDQRPAPVIAGAFPIDGDTLRVPDNPSIRLYGIDAPELKQPGFDRQGNSVPVGQQSKAALDALLHSGTALAGQPRGQSYGRAVAPVTIDGWFRDTDAGHEMVSSGDAYAAPDFLENDKTRQFSYMQAERLARLNRMGVHDYTVQPPAEYRATPADLAPRETVPVFPDTPTPNSGMRPDLELKYIELLQNSNDAQEIVDFARSAGAIIDLDATRGWIEYRNAEQKNGRQPKAYANYTEAPKLLIDDGAEKGTRALRNMGQGFLAGGLDEAKAITDSLGVANLLGADRETFWNSDRRPIDTLLNNQQQNESVLAYDEHRWPNRVMGSRLSGAVMVPYGAGARTIPQLAAVGATYGGLEGFLGTEGDLGDRTKAALIQAPVGAVVTAAGGKAIEFAAPYIGKGLDHLGTKLSPFLEAVSSRARALNAPKLADDVPPPPEGFTVDPADAADSLTTARRAAAMAADQGDAITAELPRQRDYMFPQEQPRPVSQPMSDAQMRATAENMKPSEVLPIPSNEVGSVEEAAAREAGRFTQARPVNERTELSRGTVRNWIGESIPKVGPLDMIGFLRTQGGVKDQGGELAHMGIVNNAARRGLEHVGQEARFGPLLNNERGLSLDDAAERAWEAGYFPDHTERPTINEFLEAMRGTYEGGNRHFRADDFAELDRHSATRADRFDLEQQLRDGPVYEDRSYPADEPQPFPPPQAFEDWGPSGAPDFAGNINLSKLNTPQDITRALVQIDRRVGFDPAKRGRISQAETERLAGELGMTSDDLLKRRKGQAFNAEEAFAARQILAKAGNELVNAARKVQALDNPGDELLAEFRQKWLRLVAIQEQVSGATAEAGRALAQFRMLAESRAVPGDVLGSLVKGGGGPDSLKIAAETLLDAVETTPGKFNTTAKDLAKPTWRNRVAEYYINSLLSGPQTHVVNMVSNTLTSMAQIPEFAAGAAIGKVRKAFGGDDIDRITGSEVGARAFGLVQGTKEGAKMFARALRTGEASDFASKVEGEQFRAIPGKLGEVVRLPTRFLTAEDELFKGVARRMELNGQAVRIARKEGLNGEEAKARIAELVADPTDEMYQRALDYGRYLTFQSPLGPFAQKISGLTNDSLIAKVFLPFVRTPTNLLKFATERSPAAPLLREWRKDFMAGGAKRDMAIAKMMIGTGFGATIYQMAQEGKVTGSAPSDPAKARLLYADGWQPYSVKLGDQWYSYKRLDPFATTIGFAADMATLPEGMSEKQKQDKATLLVASLMGNLASKTWLSGVSDLVSAIDEPDRYADNMVNRLVTSFLVPAAVRQTASALDPTQREAETMGDAVRARIPGMSNDLLPRRDLWGRPITNQGGFGPDFLSPLWTSKQLEDPVNRELLKLDYAPAPVKDKIGGRQLSDAEFDRYQEVAGGLAHSRLEALVQSPHWKALDPEGKAELARKTVTKARSDARTTLFSNPGSALDDAPPPAIPGNLPLGITSRVRNADGTTSTVRTMSIGTDKGEVLIPTVVGGRILSDDDAIAHYRHTGQNFGTFKSVKDANAYAEALHESHAAKLDKEVPALGEAGGVNYYADIQRQIPGATFSSGYRDAGYQADMRRRGYTPASNSAHLSGSALDVLPPPGKTQAWLAAQLRKYYPNAPLLNEGDHVHLTLPGYYGAPVLGGAKAAGVKNPYAGMPAPPPGFTLDQ